MAFGLFLLVQVIALLIRSAVGSSGAELVGLESLFTSLNGAHWTYPANSSGNWNLTRARLPGHDPCSDKWYGIVCSSSGSIVGLDFSDAGSLNVTGSLPADAFGSLTSLETMIISGGDAVPWARLHGTLPSSIGSLRSLRTLKISDAGIGGFLPQELGDLTNLETFSLFSNHFSGSVPSQLGKMLKLTNLALSGNVLSGFLPSELAQLRELTGLYIAMNSLSGTLPTEFAQLASLRELYVNNNRLTGTLPSQYGNLTALVHLSISANSLYGTLPLSLCNLKFAEFFYFSSNRFTGSIPPCFGQQSNNINNFMLFGDDNLLTGEIPPEFCNFQTTKTVVKFYFLSGNRFDCYPCCFIQRSSQVSLYFDPFLQPCGYNCSAQQDAGIDCPVVTSRGPEQAGFLRVSLYKGSFCEHAAMQMQWVEEFGPCAVIEQPFAASIDDEGIGSIRRLYANPGSCGPSSYDILLYQYDTTNCTGQGLKLSHTYRLDECTASPRKDKFIGLSEVFSANAFRADFSASPEAFTHPQLRGVQRDYFLMDNEQQGLSSAQSCNATRPWKRTIVAPYSVLLLQTSPADSVPVASTGGDYDLRMLSCDQQAGLFEQSIGLASLPALQSPFTFQPGSLPLRGHKPMKLDQCVAYRQRDSGVLDFLDQWVGTSIYRSKVSTACTLEPQTTNSDRGYMLLSLYDPSPGACAADASLAVQRTFEIGTCRFVSNSQVQASPMAFAFVSQVFVHQTYHSPSTVLGEGFFDIRTRLFSTKHSRSAAGPCQAPAVPLQDRIDSWAVGGCYDSDSARRLLAVLQLDVMGPGTMSLLAPLALEKGSTVSAIFVRSPSSSSSSSSSSHTPPPASSSSALSSTPILLGVQVATYPDLASCQNPPTSSSPPPISVSTFAADRCHRLAYLPYPDPDPDPDPDPGSGSGSGSDSNIAVAVVAGAAVPLPTLPTTTSGNIGGMAADEWEVDIVRVNARGRGRGRGLATGLATGGAIGGARASEDGMAVGGVSLTCEWALIDYMDRLSLSHGSVRLTAPATFASQELGSLAGCDADQNQGQAQGQRQGQGQSQGEGEGEVLSEERDLILPSSCLPFSLGDEIVYAVLSCTKPAPSSLAESIAAATTAYTIQRVLAALSTIASLFVVALIVGDRQRPGCSRKMTVASKVILALTLFQVAYDCSFFGPLPVPAVPTQPSAAVYSANTAQAQSPLSQSFIIGYRLEFINRAAATAVFLCSNFLTLAVAYVVVRKRALPLSASIWTAVASAILLVSTVPSLVLLLESEGLISLPEGVEGSPALSSAARARDGDGDDGVSPPPKRAWLSVLETVRGVQLASIVLNLVMTAIVANQVVRLRAMKNALQQSSKKGQAESSSNSNSTSNSGINSRFSRKRASASVASDALVEISRRMLLYPLAQVRLDVNLFPITVLNYSYTPFSLFSFTIIPTLPTPHRHSPPCLCYGALFNTPTTYRTASSTPHRDAPCCTSRPFSPRPQGCCLRLFMSGFSPRLNPSSLAGRPGCNGGLWSLQSFAGAGVLDFF